MAEFGRRGLARAVAHGDWIRARQGAYLPGDAPSAFVRAVRVGGRLTCLSLLRHHGVFVQSRGPIHIHLPRSMSRMRDPDSRRRKLAGRSRRAPVLHWHRTIRPLPDDGAAVHPVDALAHAVRCQSPREAIASIDSALFTGFIAESDLGVLFEALPRKYRALRPHIDGRAESGPETLVRLMLRALGCTVELQVEFVGVGRVDLVADGWLVIECDSRQFHSSWEEQLRDRARDIELAAQGFLTLRFTATQIMHRPHEVVDALRGVLAARRL
nr:DUF559 domain-containing protein [Microbacterium thalassium]